jgi:hypothetical protein
LFEAGVIKKLDEIRRRALRWPQMTTADGDCKKSLSANERISSLILAFTNKKYKLILTLPNMNELVKLLA